MEIKENAMTSIDKLKKDRDISLKKLDDAMEQCSPELNKMYDNVKKSKSKFLFSYNDYKNHKISDQEFLQITDSFAQILDLEKKMYDRNSKILKPLDTEFQKKCKKVYDYENPLSQDKKWWDMK